MWHNLSAYQDCRRFILVKNQAAATYGVTIDMWSSGEWRRQWQESSLVELDTQGWGARTMNIKLVASWVWFISMTLLQGRCSRRKYREACVVRRLHRHLVPWKGRKWRKAQIQRKWRKAQIQNFVIRDMFLTPNVNAYERNILLTPNGNVHKRRVLRRATQYVKACGYDKEQWTSQATTQRWWLVMVPCCDCAVRLIRWSTLVPQQSLTSESEEKHHTMPGVSYQEVLFLFASYSL